MVYTEKTKEGLVYAYVEWWIVDKDGRPDKDGKYIFVNDIWIHPAYQGNGVLRGFIRRGAKECPQVGDMYFKRERLVLYSRKQLKED